MRLTDCAQFQRLLFGLPLLLLLQLGCGNCQDFSVDTIEGSDKKLEVQPRAIVNATKPKGAQSFHCIVCDDMLDANCEPWDEFSHSKNCYEDPRIDKSQAVGCRKMVQQVQGRVYVSRQCTNLVSDSVQGCVDRVGTKKIKVTYCHCRGRQNCNTAASLRGGLQLMGLPLLLSLAALF
uniref:Protein sleepless n=1 Tax=Macrostomum lignano TaxID=282301 RepID=A0A1I8JCY9_9PLAT